MNDNSMNDGVAAQDASGSKVDVPDELVITFRKPITVGNETIDHIRLEEPEARHIAAFEKMAPKIGNVDATIVMISSIAGVSKAVVDRMKSRDLNQAQEYLSHFLGQNASQGTGETS